MSQWKSLKEQAAGKWQMPLFALSLFMLLVSLPLLSSDPERLRPDEALEALDDLLNAGAYDEGLQFGERLLSREDLADQQRAAVHLRVARAEYGRARTQRFPRFEDGRIIAGHYREAAAHGKLLTAEDYQHLGRALEWHKRYGNAVRAYQQAIDHDVPNVMELRRRVFVLERGYLAVPLRDLDGQLDRFLADIDEHRLDLRLWALSEKLDVLDELGRLGHAATLLARHKSTFVHSDLSKRFRYLEAMLLYRTGHFDEAEVLLRVIRNGLDRNDEAYAMTGWLLGRVVTRDGGPQRPLEGLSFFEEVIRHGGAGVYVTASRVGMAEALAMLRRHDRAISTYELAIEELQEIGSNRLVNRDVLRVSLSVSADALRKEGLLGPALGYSRLAASLIDPTGVEQATMFLEQLGQLQALAAEEAGRESDDLGGTDRSGSAAVPSKAQELFAQAAETYLEIARLNVLNEQWAAQATWQAAEFMVKAGRNRRAADFYRAFTLERPQHSLVPRALLRIGQLQYGAGQLAAAVDAYRECYRRFPRTLDGARALVPLARCYLAMGPDQIELAEKTLRIVLEGAEVFTPEAPEFANALFLMGDALARRGAFDEAIATLEEALQRYPDDVRTPRTRFLLGDAFRQSGLAIKRDIAKTKSEGEIRQLRAESVARFTSARALFRELISDYELYVPGKLDRLRKLYLRHAYLYEADCYFETQSYPEALKLYEEAAAMFKESPSSLVAYMQMINCQVFLGQPLEARAALARAMVLTDAIPAKAFGRSVVRETREDWKRYFDWLGRSGLF